LENTMPIIDGKEYPRLENGVVLHAPRRPAPKPAAPSVASSLDLNTASAERISKAIKGVGRKTARDIVANREADGPFRSLDDLAKRVGGVSLSQLQAADVTV
jgi:competence protein ComEA